MNKTNKIFLFIIAISLLLSFHGSGQASAPQGAQPLQRADALVSLPNITFTKGDSYFKVDGKPAFVFSRNLSGFNPNDYAVTEEGFFHEGLCWNASPVEARSS